MTEVISHILSGNLVRPNANEIEAYCSHSKIFGIKLYRQRTGASLSAARAAFSRF